MLGEFRNIPAAIGCNARNISADVSCNLRDIPADVCCNLRNIPVGVNCILRNVPADIGCCAKYENHQDGAQNNSCKKEDIYTVNIMLLAHEPY